MDDQRLAAAARGTDMGAEPLALPFQVAFQPIVIQPGFADCDHLGVRGEAYQAVPRRVLRPPACRDGRQRRAKEVRKRSAERQYGRESVPASPRRSAPNRRRWPLMAATQLIFPPVEIGEVEVAMGVDQQRIHHADRAQCAQEMGRQAFKKKQLIQRVTRTAAKLALTHARRQVRASGSSFSTPFGRGQPLW
jgi:hypothetical protein